MKPFIFSSLSLLGLSFLFSSQNAHANDTAFGGTASAPYPIHTKEIRMVSEDITIKSNANDNSWIYTCDFTFKNVSNKPVKLLMGMPFSKRTKSDDEMLSIPTGAKAPPDGQPLVWEFKTFVNGRKLRSTKVTPIVNPKLPSMDYKVAYIWSIRFRPGATHKVRNTYKLAYTSDSGGHLYAEYILKTGGLWHDGTIGRSKLKVILDDPSFLLEKGTPGKVFPMTPKGHKMSIKNGNIVIEWDLKNFKPTEDLMVVFKNGYAVLGIDYNEDFYREDFSGYNKEQLRRLRNLPYALNGYIFKDPELKKYYDSKWIIPKDKNFSDSNFPEYIQNFIKRVKTFEAKAK
jgi:hypothetical protein